MIGPAEIEDMRLEYAAAEAAAGRAGPPGAGQWPPARWSWGVGPTRDPTPGPLPRRSDEAARRLRHRVAPSYR
ncbi:hypothetical protein OPKNFCMD_5750 [Methylobacterium crusticola]|uniref:Uncharacterized protein n=1 Tax=Methylobacterium crusticola TaxID=1697972 RepID=A0ABQ4R6C8_9HYPH|nr:hypothetical protein OPKNFCMD_5750 [Methylobacterium crusticola]